MLQLHFICNCSMMSLNFVAHCFSFNVPLTLRMNNGIYWRLFSGLWPCSKVQNIEIIVSCPSRDKWSYRKYRTETSSHVLSRLGPHFFKSKFLIQDKLTRPTFFPEWNWKQATHLRITMSDTRSDRHVLNAPEWPLAVWNNHEKRQLPSWSYFFDFWVSLTSLNLFRICLYFCIELKDHNSYNLSIYFHLAFVLSGSQVQDN